MLFPFVGGVKNKVYRHEGKEYPMNQHGFARDMDFTLISRSTDEAWLALEDTDETRLRSVRIRHSSARSEKARSSQNIS